MTQRIQEYVDSRGGTLRLDREQGLLRGVKLLGLASRNGRTYRPAALEGALPLYEGAKVNVNHPKGSPHSPRDYQDRIGVIRDVEFRPGEGLFGTLQINPKHPLAEQLMWDAEHAPQQVGLSHNVLARTSGTGDGVVVEAITQVESVDLVADPATTRGLFEQQQPPIEQPRFFESLTLESLRAARPDLIEAACGELRTQQQRLERRLRIAELLAEQGLPLPGRDAAITSDAFVATLLEAENDQVLRARIADRAALVRAGRTSNLAESREQSPLGLTDHREACPTAKAFAEALRAS